MKFDKNYASVNTSLLILNLLKSEEMYGYQIISELTLQSKNVFEFKEGTLYPILHTMEKDGFVKCRTVKTESNRNRKYYKLTALGEKQLKRKKEEWQMFSTTVNAMLDFANV